MIVGVTGCVGAGKSTVCRILAARGWSVLDVDALVARLLDESGVDKRALFAAAMTNGALRSRLTHELRPRVVRYVEEWAAQLDRHGALECALLFELGFQTRCAVTWCVTCSPAERRRRVEARTTASAQHFAAIEAAQWSEAEKVARADVALSTEGPVSALEGRVVAALERVERLEAHGNGKTRECMRDETLGETSTGVAAPPDFACGGGRRTVHFEFEYPGRGRLA